MRSPLEKYIKLIQIMADDFAEKGYVGISESDLKKYYSVDDLSEVSGLYLMTLSENHRADYLINSANIYDIADKISLYMSSPVSFFDNEKWPTIQGGEDTVINTICNALVAETLQTVIRDINDNITSTLDDRDFYFQSLSAISPEQSHYL